MNPQMEKAKHWVITTVVSMLGGGAAAGFGAMMDPSKYDIRHDLFSGKLWKYVFMGWGLTFAGIMVKSPLGQKVIAVTKQNKEQLEQTQRDLDQAKADLKAAMGPTPATPPDKAKS
jgi:hypothetical protein